MNVLSAAIFVLCFAVAKQVTVPTIDPSKIDQEIGWKR
jgi:hypothetical protein